MIVLRCPQHDLRAQIDVFANLDAATAVEFDLAANCGPRADADFPRGAEVAPSINDGMAAHFQTESTLEKEAA